MIPMTQEKLKEFSENMVQKADSIIHEFVMGIAPVLLADDIVLKADLKNKMLEYMEQFLVNTKISIKNINGNECQHLTICIPNILSKQPFVTSIKKNDDTGYVSWGTNQATEDMPASGKTYYYKWPECIDSLKTSFLEVVIAKPFRKITTHEIEQSVKDENTAKLVNDTSDQLFNIYRQYVHANLACFISELDQDVVETMRIAQFPGVVFYNWLLGCPRAIAEDDLPPPPDQDIAKKRQQFVRDNPQLGHIIGYLLAHGTPIGGNTGGIGSQPANATIFELEANHSDIVKLNAQFIAKQFLYYENLRESITSQMLSPDFWKGAEDQLRDIVETCNGEREKFDSYTILSEVLGTIDTCERHKNAKPSFPRGLVL